VTSGGTGAFVLQWTATPSSAGTFANPRSGGICGVDPDGLIVEGNETNNACGDVVNVIGADLQLTKVISSGVSGGIAIAGTNVTYLITATNNGPNVAANVVVTDNLPANTTLFSCTSSAGGCGYQTNGVTAGLATLANGAQFTMTIVVTIGSGVASGTVITNTAGVTSSVPDPNLGNNTAGPVRFTVQQPGPADLQLTKVISAGAPGGIAIAGANVTYLLTVTNNGPNATVRTVATDGLPANATFVSCASSVGNCFLDHLNVVTAAIGSLANGAAATVTITVNIGCGVVDGTVIANTASVIALNPDPNPGNNTGGPATFTVRQPGISVNASVALSIFTQNNHDLLNPGLAASTSKSACPFPINIAVQVLGNEDDQTPTAKNEVYSPDAANIALGSLRLRAERVDSGNGRVYLIVVRATDTAGGAGFGTATVVVPKSASADSVASVLSQEAAAAAYTNANNGAMPPSYFVIGDGPVIGPKQ
jgi:uncharacterized repeat protein (TIGR01451 family)